MKKVILIFALVVSFFTSYGHGPGNNKDSIMQLQRTAAIMNSTICNSLYPFASLDLQQIFCQVVRNGGNTYNPTQLCTPQFPFASLDLWQIYCAIKADSGTGGGKVSIKDSAWTLFGNSGTVDGTNFLGTTDGVPLTFRVNNVQAGRIEISNNTYFGYSAGQNNTGSFNVGIGNSVLSNHLGLNFNVAIGYQAMLSDQFGYQTVAIGAKALMNNIQAGRNVAVGYVAMTSNVFGEANTAIGWQSLTTNDSGAENTADGAQALALNIHGNSNSAVGYQAGVLNSTGNNNTYIGSSSGSTNALGNDNSYLGFNATSAADGFSNATAIGANSIVTKSNAIQLGPSSDSNLFFSTGALKHSSLVPNVNYNTSTGEFTVNTAPNNVLQVFKDSSGLTTPITLLTYPAPVTGVYRIGGTLTVQDESVDVLEYEVNFTDPSAGSTTIIFHTANTWTTFMGVANTSYALVPMDIQVETGTNIIISTILSTGGGSIAYFCTGNIIFLHP